MEYHQTWADENPTTQLTVTISSDVMRFLVKTAEGNDTVVSEYTTTTTFDTTTAGLDVMYFWIELFKNVKVWPVNVTQDIEAHHTMMEAYGQLERLFLTMGHEVTALNLTARPNVTWNSSDFVIPMRVINRLVSMTVTCVTNLAEEELDLSPKV